MKKILSYSLMLMVALAAGAFAEDKVGESPYYPTKIGTTWTYRIGEKKLTQKVTKHEKQGNYFCARIETIVDGNTVATEHIHVTKDGLFRVAYNGEMPDKPVMFFKLPPKTGESWNVEAKVANESVKGKFTISKEKVKVPAGEIDSFLSKGDFDVNGQPAKFNYWITEGKGIVKLEMAVGGQSFAIELEKYEEGQ